MKANGCFQSSEKLLLVALEGSGYASTAFESTLFLSGMMFGVGSKDCGLSQCFSAALVSALMESRSALRTCKVGILSSFAGVILYGMGGVFLLMCKNEYFVYKITEKIQSQRRTTQKIFNL